MPRRSLLTDAQRSRFWLPPTEELDLLRHYTLSPEDLTLVNRRRRDPNRLGFALMLCYLRFPGRVLEQGERPPETMLRFLAEQVGVVAWRGRILLSWGRDTMSPALPRPGAACHLRR